ncbi:hypothetical protein VTO42DRAFT_6673 [Malbranchea cinnamomea]
MMDSSSSSPETKLECRHCGTKFGYKSSLVRHLKKKCNKLNASNNRRKSCHLCVLSKTRCDLKHPSCSRCSARRTPCRYPNMLDPANPPNNLGPSEIGTAAVSSAGPDVFDTLLADVAPSWTHSTNGFPSDSMTDLFPVLGSSGQQDIESTTTTGISDSNVMLLSNGTNNVPSLLETIPNQYLLPEPTETPSGATVLTTHGMEFAFKVLRGWPRMLAEEFQLPPLIHFTQVNPEKTLPQPLANCITLAKMWHWQCEGAEQIVQDTVLGEVNNVLNKMQEYDEIDLLAALQALVMHLIMLLFPSKNSTRPVARDDLMYERLKRLISQLVTTGLFLQEERKQVRPSWEAWIHITSKRRAVLSLFLLQWAYSVFHGIPPFDCKGLGFMPAPAAKALWQARTEDEWNSLYVRWLTRWNGQGFLQCELAKIRPGIRMEPRAERWLEETDDFGLIMIAAVEIKVRTEISGAQVH